jgi:hypothetical protein
MLILLLGAGAFMFLYLGKESQAPPSASMKRADVGVRLPTSEAAEIEEQPVAPVDGNTGPRRTSRGSYALSVMASEPYLYYRMRGAGAAVEDVSGNGRHGVVRSKVRDNGAAAEDQLLHARAFDRESRYVTTGTGLATLPATLGAGFTFEAIVRTNAKRGEGGALFAAFNGDALWVGDLTAIQLTMREMLPLELRLLVRDGDGTTATSYIAEDKIPSSLVDLSDGLPHHVVATFDGATNPTPSSFQIFIDGHSFPLEFTLQGPGNGLDRLPAFAANRPRFGAGGRDEPKMFFPGSLEEIAIYNRVLSKDEIKAHYREFQRWR